MNTKKVKFALMTILGFSVFMIGCGPLDVNDPEYLAQIQEEDVINEHKMEVPDKVADVVERPQIVVHKPTISRTSPTKIIKTAESLPQRQVINIIQEEHRHHPTVNEHTVNYPLTVERRHYKKIFNHPSFAKKIFTHHSVTETDKVMPTTEVTSPVTTYTTPVVAAYPYVYGMYRYPVLYHNVFRRLYY